jgi:hypothetical protein
MLPALEDFWMDMQKFAAMDPICFEDLEDRSYHNEVKLLANKIGWDRFFQVILGPLDDLNVFLYAYDLEEDLSTIKSIRRNAAYYMKKYVK